MPREELIQVAKIMMVASEATPFVKTGGLADVLGALPPELVKLGHQVVVVLPKYRTLKHTQGMWRVRHGLPVWLNGIRHDVHIDAVERGGVNFLFVDAPEFFDRDGIYHGPAGDYADNHRRFAILSLSALAIAQMIEMPDVIHVHDWQAALVPLYARLWFGADARLQRVKYLMTIHNLGYLGRFGRHNLPEIGLDDWLFHPDHMEFWGDISLLKAGLIYSDWLTTVSPTYAREIQTQEYGEGLDGLLRNRSHRLTGILNGVDYQEWNPATDRYLAANYSPKDLGGKLACKQDLVRYFGLPEAAMRRPLLGIVSRFAEQKGFDLVASIAGQLANEDLTLVALGSGEPRFEQLFRDLTGWRPDKFANWIGYSNEMAHKIEAGSDIFLMPSRYEPCGLNQIYSLKYGTPPVVRATGGLDDTIEETTGYKFHGYSGQVLLDTIRRAISDWADRDSWEKRMVAGMEKDFSWGRSAREYVRLYESLLAG